MTTSQVPPAVTWGLLVSWLVHDLEEVATVAAFARAYEQQVGRRLPVSPEQMAAAVTTIGLLVVVASVRGVTSGGRSRLFRRVLLAHAAHSVWHVGASVALRGYTPGVVTAAVVVGPHGWWALRRLRETQGWAGSAQLGELRTVVPGAVAAVLCAHLLARGVVRHRTTPSADPTHVVNTSRAGSRRNGRRA